MATKVKQDQLKNSANPGSLIVSDTSNIFQIKSPSLGADHIWFYDHSATDTVALMLGTNLSISGTTLNSTAGAGGYSVIQEEGATVGASNTTINFIGTGITAADATGGVTSVTLNSFLNTLATAGSVNLASAVSGDLPFANLAQGSGLSVLGVTGSSTADNASIVAGTDHQVLRRSGTAVAFGAINLAQSAAVTGILPIANGGTGSATQNFVDLTTNQTIAGTKTFSNNITINGTPSAPTDAATVGYVTTVFGGIRKGSVRVATTANGTLATAFANGQTIDGVTLATGDLILLKNQTAQAENGVYTVNASGAPTRATWMDTAVEIDGVYVAVEDGTTNVGTLWITVSEVTTLGTDAIVFTQIQTTGTVTGTGVANKVAYWNGTSSLTSTTNFHFSGTQLALGTATPATSVMLTTQGTGTTNATFGIQHQDSSANQVFRVADDGTTVIGASTPLTITNTGLSRSGASITLSPGSQNNINLNTGNNGSVNFGETFTWNATTGTVTSLKSAPSIAPSSGTAIFNLVSLTPAINQTGGANGIIRSVLIAPTITAAADYRGLEITANSSHYALYTTAGKVRFDLGSDATGDIWYRGSGGEMIRLGVGSNGQVLTLASGLPSWAASASATVTEAYVVLASGSTTIDLDANVGNVKDVDGNNIAFTIPTNLALFQVWRNGVLMDRSGTVTRDYSVNTTTHVITFVTTVGTDETIYIRKLA